MAHKSVINRENVQRRSKSSLMHIGEVSCFMFYADMHIGEVSCLMFYADMHIEEVSCFTFYADMHTERMQMVQYL